jgi:hypothetical protein
MTLLDEVKKEVVKSNSIGEIKSNLIKRGFLEMDIDEALHKLIHAKTEERTRNNRILSIKELFDRIGYGFASQQFVNILFMLSGASYLMIGFINGLKASLTYLLSGLLKEYATVKYIGKKIISTSGIIFGFSFLGMAFAVMISNPLLFGISMIIGALGIIAHGDLYVEFYNALLKNEKRKEFLRFISYFGIIITAGSMLLAGFIIESFPINGYLVSFNLSFFGIADTLTFRVLGYLLTFEVTAIMFILSGYLLSFIEEAKEEFYSADATIKTAFNKYIKGSLENTSIFAKNSKTLLLTIATILTTIAQILGNSYYGIYIYETFRDKYFEGFLNVAIIFVIALIASISGTLLTKKFAKTLGEAPMLVFGTLLIALLPITFYYNPRLYAIGLATALSVIGGAIVGVAQGLIAERMMSEDEVKRYFSSLGFVSIVPTLLLVLVGAIIAQAISVEKLFFALAILLVAVVMPIYFTIVLIVESEYRKLHSKR